MDLSRLCFLPARLLALPLVAVLTGCPGSNLPFDDAGLGGDGGRGATIEAAERSCNRTVIYRPINAVTSVQVVGEWNWDSPRDLALQPDGTFALQLTDLAGGLYAYKLIVDGNWILDPQNDYRAYTDGVENSGLRIPDCSRPLVDLIEVETTSSSLRITASLFRGIGGPPLNADKTKVTLWMGTTEVTSAALSIEPATGAVAVTASGLIPGKYTLRLTTADTNDAFALPVLVPVWVEAEGFSWNDALIYMIMLDRYRNGNPSNDPGPSPGATASADWHGGDLAGITESIEAGELDELGITAIWLSPFVHNPAGVFEDGGNGVSGYHGYWPTKARQIDPRFGTENELDALVAAAHAHGIRVLMDYVLNHVHQEHEYFSAHPEWFRTGCKCGDPGCDWTEHRLDCLFQPYLPDIDWRQRAASETFVADALWWLERFDLDGLRVDAVKHVEDLAIFNLGTRVRETFERGGTEYFLLGETAMGWAGDSVEANANEYATISRYIGPNALSGQFDFVLYHAASYNVFAYQTHTLAHADFWAKQSLASYPEDAIMTPFIGSHDAPRFVSMAAGDPRVNNKWPEQGLPTQPTESLPYDKTLLGLVWVLTQPGAPLLYYGDEYGEYGGADPDNRHMWRADQARSADEKRLRLAVARLGGARKTSLALRRGTYQTLIAEDDLLVYSRAAGTDVAFVALHNGSAPQSRVINLPAAAAAASSYIDVLSGESVPVSGSSLTLQMAPLSARVLVAAP